MNVIHVSNKILLVTNGVFPIIPDFASLIRATCCIILLDPDASENGGLAWTAELPQTHDAFVAIEMHSDGLHAVTWSGFNVTLNPETGQVIRQEFVK
jgi:hypothetical protein